MWCCRRRSTKAALVVSHSSSGARLTSINFSFSSSTAFIRSSDAFITATCAVRTWRTLTLHFKGTLRAQRYSSLSRVIRLAKRTCASLRLSAAASLDWSAAFSLCVEHAPVAAQSTVQRSMCRAACRLLRE